MTEEEEEEQTAPPAPPQRAVAGVRFKDGGRVFYFDAKDIELTTGQQVIVRTIQGPALARVVIAPGQLVASEIAEPLEPVLRIAQPEDLERAEALQSEVHEDLTIARKKVEEHGLDMRLVGGEMGLDGAQLTLYFTAAERVDFRTLVRDLSSALNKRVQLLQVGDRDRAKLCGDMGQCGYTLCCRSWLIGFPSISIKMAKEQDVPLNPSKISGVCGRLLCCLAFEHEQYRELRGKLPKVGQIVSTPAGEAKLVAVHVLKQTVSLRMLEGGPTVEMTMDELRGQYGTVVRPVDGGQGPQQAPDPRPVESTLPPPPPPRRPAPRSDEPAAAEAQGDLAKKRRRKRGGRGGRRRRPGGADSAPSQ